MDLNFIKKVNKQNEKKTTTKVYKKKDLFNIPKSDKSRNKIVKKVKIEKSKY